MASNNDSGDGCLALFMLILLGIAAYVAFLIAMAVYAFVLFCSVIMTFLSLLAWHRGLRFLGLNIDALHARMFILRGLLGAVLFPAFAFFVSWYYGIHIADWLWPHIAFGGYALCSAGVLFMGLDGGIDLAEDLIEINPSPHRQGLTPPRTALGPAQSERDAPRFASWDDEEELGR